MAVVKKTYPIQNMMCAMCVQHVQKAIAAVEGVKDVNVNLASNSALIEYDDAQTNAEKIKEAVTGAGYGMLTDETATGADAAEEAQKKTSAGFLKKLFGR